jgi:hypothetical protein
MSFHTFCKTIFPGAKSPVQAFVYFSGMPVILAYYSYHNALQENSKTKYDGIEMMSGALCWPVALPMAVAYRAAQAKKLKTQQATATLPPVNSPK